VGRPFSARQALALASASAPVAVAATTIRAESELALGDRSAALASFEEAWAANRRCGVCDPSSAIAWAGQLEHEQRAAEAGRVLDEVLAAEPRSAEAHLARARQLMRAGSARQALEHGLLALQQAHGVAARRAAHALLAQAYAALGETREAERHATWIDDQP
jgi:tetratricopeptide (TPR) repeat protein